MNWTKKIEEDLGLRKNMDKCWKRQSIKKNTKQN